MKPSQGVAVLTMVLRALHAAVRRRSNRVLLLATRENVATAPRRRDAVTVGKAIGFSFIPAPVYWWFVSWGAIRETMLVLRRGLDPPLLKSSIFMVLPI
jgi:hypothetical protein